MGLLSDPYLEAAVDAIDMVSEDDLIMIERVEIALRAWVEEIGLSSSEIEDTADRISESGLGEDHPWVEHLRALTEAIRFLKL